MPLTTTNVSSSPYELLRQGGNYASLLVGGSIIAVNNSRLLTNADDGAHLVYSGAGAITLTVPAGLAAAFGCSIEQNGAGQVTLSGSGATVNNVGGFTKTAGQYAVLALIADGIDTYVFSGSAA